MSQFTTELKVSLIGDNLWQLLESFEYHVGEYPSKEIIKVPVGFKTDFASIPRVFWSILSPTGKYGKAAVIHDWCYWSACYNRKQSDKIFLEGMVVLKVSKWKQEVMYRASRQFGGFAWKRHRNDKHELVTIFQVDAK
jgi:hypothetical protein